MTTMNKEFNFLLKDMGKCLKCMNMHKGSKDCSLVNIYKNIDFAKSIPSIWTDWLNRLDAEIMIIGQDWGPFQDMVMLNKSYINNHNWQELMNSEKSLTKKMLYNYLLASAKLYGKVIDEEYINKIYITNAIMCARQGHNYRGDNIKLKECTLNCSEFLKRQIDIVKPKVILTLGYYPLLSLAKIYGFDIPNNLRDIVKDKDLIKIDKMVIIPAFHPTAQIKKEVQLEQYSKIWKYVD